jgi:hypothetical protein
MAAAFARHDRYKLELSCAAADSQLLIDLRYDTDLFRQEEVAYLAEQFEALVEHAIAEPDTFVSDLRVRRKQRGAGCLKTSTRLKHRSPPINVCTNFSSGRQSGRPAMLRSRAADCG